MNEIKEDRPASAAIAIHTAWFNHSSSFECFKEPRLLPDTPVDMLLLFKVAAATFEQWPPQPPNRRLPEGGNVTNLDSARNRLQSMPDSLNTTLAWHFLRNVIQLSKQSSCPQDLEYFLELFLRGIAKDGVIDAIASGAISAQQKERAGDLDWW
ncbi:MAG: hypothetical protein L0Y72_14750 [Gemmataceae bacterium]|nr:hypothetical protein [Gemmataceae bacterium]MCI0740301.1 hypothetical protein [Gemmataceae bacterium]